jgi:hypothetical protein
MDFRTKITLSKHQKHSIDHRSKLFLMGSCFSDSIGSKFIESGFESQSNPFGTIFHPIAIEGLITRIVNKRQFELDDLEHVNGLHSCLEVHSKFNNSEAATVLAELNSVLKYSLEAMKAATHVFITLGTAWVYKHIPRNRIVANCHKIPQKQFAKELLSVEEIQTSLENISALITQIKPSATIVFTVSPVRHLKDGFVENNRSKSHLLTAVHNIVEANSGTYYFPAYELLIDELRDYRFYNSDMVHPSEVAIDYIWERFQTVWLTQKAIHLSKEVVALRQSLNHRAFQPNSQEHQNFLKHLELKKLALLKKLPHLEF